VADIVRVAEPVELEGTADAALDDATVAWPTTQVADNKQMKQK